MIPKHFHHTWPSGGEFPQVYQDYRNTFMKKHPDFGMTLWTPDDVHHHALSQDSLDLQQNPLLHYVVKADISRHEILYKFGGIYLDTDMECLKSLYPFLDHRSFAGASYSPNKVGNGCIGTEAGNPLFKDIAEAIVDNIMRQGIRRANDDPPGVSGPNFIGYYLSKLEVILPLHYFYPFKWDAIPERPDNPAEVWSESYMVHWWAGMTGWVKDARNAA